MKHNKTYVIIGAIALFVLSLATMAGYTQIVIHFEGFKNELAFSFITLFLAFVLFVLGFGKEEESFGNNVKKN
jgi:high-affinity Fe2+/Pb2+ permease